MVVQHNMQAMNANRMLNITTTQQSKSTEKLSSGYRINRAADDAAGLSISEKMRKQIRGLDQASTNAQDGVSAVQTAEGALTEVHSMLQRMNELAVQAANGTNSESDRQSIQDEIDQLTTEIDRVAETTKFNETYLLKGNAAGNVKDMKVAAHDAGLAGKLTDNGNGTYTFALDEALKDGDKVTIAGKEYTIGTTKTDDDYVKIGTADAVVLETGDSVTHEGVTKTVVDKATVADAKAAGLKQGDTFTDKDGIKWTVSNTATDPANKIAGTVGLQNIADALKAGSTITKLDGKDVKIEVVDGYASDEYSSVLAANTATDVAGAALVAGDVITKADGTSQTVTAETPESFSDIKKEIQTLVADGSKTVVITPAGEPAVTAKTYTVVEESAVDEKNKKLTREDIIALINEGDTVNVGATGNETVYGVDETVEEDTITAEDAYRMMTEELTKASSIGTDEAAKVVKNQDNTFTITQGTVEVKEGLSFSLHVGADADMTNKINVEIESMSAACLGIKGINVKDETGAAATYAIDVIADAISKVSSQRSALGAVQNRLEHTIDNLDNVVENTTSAESRIRDTDMAEEMVEYSKNNILAQAGQSMLAQANQANQGVLSLLG